MPHRSSAHRLPSNKRIAPKDFTGGVIHAPSVYRGTTGDHRLDGQVHKLVQGAEIKPELQHMVAGMIITALRAGREGQSVGDMKLMNRSLRELRRAWKVFQPYNEERKVVVYGSARTLPTLAEYQLALEFGRHMAGAGWMVMTGAGDGIMGAAQEGAGKERSFGLNIKLPFEQGANPTITGDPKLMSFNYFFTRKLTFVKEADAVALFPGGFGTMDECFELLTLVQTGKSQIIPIIMIDVPGGTYWSTFQKLIEESMLHNGLISPTDLSLYLLTTSLEAAAEEIERFYRIFHSYRYLKEQLIIRIKSPLKKEEMGRISEEFADLFVTGGLHQCSALPDELDEPKLAALPRLCCQPHRTQFGRIRQLIDAINRCAV